MATVNAHKTGPGLLTFGETASAQETSIMVTKCKVTPESEDGDKVPVLSGDVLLDGGESSAKLEFDILQNYEVESFIKWTWDNDQKEYPFTFVPNKAYAMKISGTVKVAALEVGGDIDKRNTSSATWTCSKMPKMTMDNTPTTATE